MAQPAYRLTLEDRSGYLYALLEGEQDSYETSLAAVTEVANLCRSRNVAKLLVEHTMTGRLSTLDVYKMASQLPDLYQGIHVGFVIRQAAVPDNPQFLERVAQNRGAQGRLFADVGEAEAWLLTL